MKGQILLYIKIILFMAGLAFIAQQLLLFSSIYLDYKKIYNAANIKLAGDCKDKAKMSALLETTDCLEKEKLIMLWPSFRALLDVLSTWGVCEQLRCKIFYKDVTEHIYLITLLIFSLIVVWIVFVGKHINDQRNFLNNLKFSLPFDRKLYNKQKKIN